MPLKPSKSIVTEKPAIAVALLILSSALSAAPPAPLTPAQLNGLDQLAAPMKERIAIERMEAQKIIKEDTERSSDTEVNLRAFLISIGQGSLLTQNTSTTTPSVTPATLPVTPNTSDPKATPSVKPKQTTLKVECDNGLYFDSENGVLAYLKNVRLTEPRFNLTCSDELKVFLEQKPAEPAKKTDPKAKTPPTETTAKDKNTKKKDKSMASFGDLKRIVATGNVKVTQKDDNGRLFIASSDMASYDAKTGEMILKGGMPRLQQSSNQYLQAMEPGQWIRIHKNGKLVTSKGKWVMQTTTTKP